MIVDKLHGCISKKHVIHLCSCDKCGTLFTSYKNSHNKDLCKECKSREIIGEKINRLLVLDVEYRMSKNGKTIRKYAKCKCDCGEICYIRTDCLGENTKSCGCLTHKLYRVYYGVLQRCYNSKNKAYKYYGERGIKVCDEWKDDYNKFYDWAISNGWEKGLQLDRIDTNGNYEPNNCRFVTPKENVYNTRRNVLLWYNEKWRTIEEISKIEHKSWNTIYGRYVTNEKTKLPKKWLYGKIKGGGLI